MIVPGGGLSHDRSRWVSCRPNFFLPVRVLSRLFRRRFLKMLLAAHDADRLKFFGDYASLAERATFTAFLSPLKKVEWVVYAKEPFAGPQPVLRYLSRYTHRVAILAIALALSPLATRSRARRHCSSINLGLRPMCTPRLRAAARPSLAVLQPKRSFTFGRILSSHPRRLFGEQSPAQLFRATSCNNLELAGTL